MQPKRLKALTLIDKLKIIEEVEGGAKKKEVAERYGLPLSTLRSMLKIKPSILQFIESTGECSDSKTIKKPTYQRINEALLQWLKESQSNNLSPTGPIIQQKALELANELGEVNFKASTGWLKTFKRSYNFTEKKRNQICRTEAHKKEFRNECPDKRAKVKNKKRSKGRKFGLRASTSKSIVDKNNDQSNSAESYSVNEDIDIKSEILEFGPTEYLASSFLSSSDHEQDYQAIGTYFAQKIALLQPDQRTYALKFINDILNEANQGSLHSNSIEINRLPPNPLECKNAASFPQNSSHHDNNEGSRCDIKPDITKLIPIPEFNEPIATPTFNVPSTFVPPYGCNPDITDDTKPDISRLAIPGTSAAALSIIPQSIGTYEIINTSTSGSSLTQPYKDHSYIHKKADKSKTGQTDVVLPVSNFGTLSQIVVPAKITKYENVAFEIFEEKE